MGFAPVAFIGRCGLHDENCKGLRGYGRYLVSGECNQETAEDERG